MSFENHPVSGETATINYDRQGQTGEIILEYRYNNGTSVQVIIDAGEDSVDIQVPDSAQTVTVQDISNGSAELVETVHLFLPHGFEPHPWFAAGVGR